MSQLTVGDAIMITHPTTLQEETKIVRMVLSNVSIGISSAFSTDLISTTPFRYALSSGFFVSDNHCHDHILNFLRVIIPCAV